MGILLGGTVVVEEVFTLPGVGRLVLWSIYQRDYPLTQSHHPLHRRDVHDHQPGGRRRSTAISIPASATAAEPTEAVPCARSVLFEQGKPLSGGGAWSWRPRGTGEVLVRMAASGVCHSLPARRRRLLEGRAGADRAGRRGRRRGGGSSAPASTALALGDHVILSWAPTCGRCHYCVIGRPNLCERRQPGRGRAARRHHADDRCDGRPVYHYGHVATYASRTVVHESCAIRIDPAHAARPRRPHRLLGHDRRGRGDQHRGGAAGREHGRLRRGRRRAQRGPGRRAGGRAPDHRGGRRGRPSSSTRARSAPPTRSTPRGKTRWRPSAAITGRGADYTFVAVGDTRAGQPGDRRAGARRHLRADRRARDRRHRPARRAAAGHRRARHPRLQLRQRAHARGPAAAGQPLPGRQAAHRRADHPSLRRSTRPTRRSARSPPASSAAG